MLLAIDLTAGAILLLIDLLLFLPRKLATVGLAIRMNLLVDSCSRFSVLPGFAGSHLAAADALRNAVLPSDRP